MKFNFELTSLEAQSIVRIVTMIGEGANDEKLLDFGDLAASSILTVQILAANARFGPLDFEALEKVIIDTVDDTRDIRFNPFFAMVMNYNVDNFDWPEDFVCEIPKKKETVA